MSTRTNQLSTGNDSLTEVTTEAAVSPETTEPTRDDVESAEGDEEQTFPVKLWLTWDDNEQLALLTQRMSALLNEEEVINAVVVAGLEALGRPEHSIWARVQEKQRQDQSVLESLLRLPKVQLAALVETLAVVLGPSSLRGEYPVKAADFPSPRKGKMAMRTLAETLPFVYRSCGCRYEHVGIKPGQVATAEEWLARASVITGQSIE